MTPYLKGQFFNCKEWQSVEKYDGYIFLISIFSEGEYLRVR